MYVCTCGAACRRGATTLTRVSSLSRGSCRQSPPRSAPAVVPAGYQNAHLPATRQLLYTARTRHQLGPTLAALCVCMCFRRLRRTATPMDDRLRRPPPPASRVRLVVPHHGQTCRAPPPTIDAKDNTRRDPWPWPLGRPRRRCTRPCGRRLQPQSTSVPVRAGRRVPRAPPRHPLHPVSRSLLRWALSYDVTCYHNVRRCRPAPAATTHHAPPRGKTRRARPRRRGPYPCATSPPPTKRRPTMSLVRHHPLTRTNQIEEEESKQERGRRRPTSSDEQPYKKREWCLGGGFCVPGAGAGLTWGMFS